MNNKHLGTIILFGTVILTGLMVVQVYWFRRAFSIAEKQFDHSVQIALMKVADTVSEGAEVRKLSSNFFFVATESALNNDSLDTLLKAELLDRSLDLDYALGIYKADDDTLVYGHYVEATQKHLLEQKNYDGTATGVQKNFAVYFPRKESFVTAQLDVWIFSTVILLLMMCFFAYAVATLLRERKFAELKNDFINNMTHEFKTPLTNIGIATEIIRKKMTEDTGSSVYLDVLMKENDKLRRKIDQILSASAIDHLKSPALEPISIHQLISDCAEAFQLKIQQRSGCLRLELNAKNDMILADRELLVQALSNVIDNAEKYSGVSPSITVRTAEDRNGIEIDVTDHGLGIPAHMTRKVFEKFFRVPRGNVHDVKGFGLGLNFVKTVIRAHKGRIDLFSKVNEGTNVKIYLPKV